MTTQDARDPVPQGTLDLLILRTLELGREHGQGIARTIERGSEGAFLVEHGSLYPALQRLERRGCIAAEWGVSSNNRRARFYALTARGRRELAEGTGQWLRVTDAISRVLGMEPEGG